MAGLDWSAVDRVLTWTPEPDHCRCPDGMRPLPLYTAQAQGYLHWVIRQPSDSDGWSPDTDELDAIRKRAAARVLEYGAYGASHRAEIERLAQETWGATAPTFGAEEWARRVSLLEPVAHQGQLVLAAKIAGLAVALRVDAMELTSVADLARRCVAEISAHPHPDRTNERESLGLELRREAAAFGAARERGLVELARCVNVPAGGSRAACLAALVRTELGATASSEESRVVSGRARRLAVHA